MKKNNSPYNHKSGYLIPQGYFEGLEDEILDMVKLSENLKNTDKSTGFSTPIGYFDGLEDKILEEGIKKHPKLRKLLNNEVFLYAASIAAIVVALASTFYINPETKTSWENIELSVMESYIDENNIDFSTGEISRYIFQQGYLVDDADFNSMNSDAMMNYLDEHVEDPLYILDAD